MPHNPTAPHQRVSPLRQARLDHGWTQAEAAARIRARCPGPEGIGCQVNAARLDHFETGLRHPGPAHVRVLTDLYQRTATDLGLVVWPESSDDPPTDPDPND